MAAGLDGVEPRCDTRRDSVIARLIAGEEDMVDSNVVDIDDGADGGRGCEVVDCNDLQVPSVDMAQLEVHSELPGQHAPRSLHRGTFPSGGGCASNACLSWAVPGLQTDAATERSKRSGVISDGSTLLY